MRVELLVVRRGTGSLDVLLDVYLIVNVLAATVEMTARGTESLLLLATVQPLWGWCRLLTTEWLNIPRTRSWKQIILMSVGYSN